MNMYSRIASLVIALCAVATFSVAGAAAASTEAPGQQSSVWVEDQVRGILEHNPGSSRVDADSVELEKGVVMSVTPAGVAADECNRFYRTGFLCLYQHTSYGGYAISFYECGYRNLWNYTMPDGRHWNSKASSIINGQYGSVVSKFYDVLSGGTTRLIGSLTSHGWYADLTRVNDPYGGTLNDKIDRVFVC